MDLKDLTKGASNVLADIALKTIKRKIIIICIILGAFSLILLVAISGGADGGIVANAAEFNDLSSGIEGETTEERVWLALRGAGFSEYATAGVMGNIYAESNFSTSAVESNGVGHGLCQWSYGRCTQLMNYASSKGKTWSDEYTQIEFLLTEITGAGSATGYATYQMAGTYNGYTYDSWKNATSVNDATLAFLWVFERPGVPRTDVRLEAAQRYYNEFHGRTYSNSSGDFLTVAKECHDYFRENNFTYVQGNQIPYPNGTTHTDCSAYVSWVLYEYGYKEEFAGWQKTTHWFMNENNWKKYGWSKVSISQAKAGDILVNNERMEIYAGGNKILNCGCVESIRQEYDTYTNVQTRLNEFVFAIRIPNRTSNNNGNGNSDSKIKNMKNSSKYGNGRTWLGDGECFGFVNAVTKEYYGYECDVWDPNGPRNSARLAGKNWIKSTSKDALYNVKPGDAIRYWGSYYGHSVWVIAVSGNGKNKTLTFAEANWDNKNGISWTRTSTIDEVANNHFDYICIAPYAIGKE